MTFTTFDPDCALVLELDDEHEEVDLTERQDGRTIGDQILDLAVEEMIAAVGQKQAPGGDEWPELASSTVRQKGHGTIGFHRGRSGLLNPANWYQGPRDVQARSLYWKLAAPNPGQAQGWQQGNDRNNSPPRPLVGWTEAAKARARSLIGDADLRARS